MATRSKSSDDIGTEEKKRLGAKLAYALGAGWLRGLAFVIACVSMLTCITLLMQIDSFDYSELLTGNKFTETESYIGSKDDLYQTLCVTASVYLRNCKDNEYQGSEALLKNLRRSLRDYEYGSRVKFTIEDGKPVIESNLFDYYVSFEGGGVITNIKEYENKYLSAGDIADFEEESSFWYVRRLDQVSTDIDTSNGSAFAIVNDYSEYEGNTDFDYEEYNEYSIPLGWSGKDNYGRYILCYGPYNDLMIYDFDTSDATKRYIINGGKRVTPPKNYDDFENPNNYSEFSYALDENGEEYVSSAYLSLTDMDGYEFTTLDDNNITVLIRPNKSLLTNAETTFANNAKTSSVLVKRLAIFMLTAAVSVLYLLVICGYRRTAPAGKRWNRMLITGKWCDEAVIIVGVLSAVAAYIPVDSSLQLEPIIRNIFAVPSTYSLWIISAISTFFGAIALLMLLTLVSKLKSRTFISDILIFMFFKKVGGWCSRKFRENGMFASYEKGSVQKKLFVREWIFIAATIAEIIVTLSSDYGFYYTEDDISTLERSFYPHAYWVIATLAYAGYLIWFMVTQFRIYRDLKKLDEQIDKMSSNGEPEFTIDETSPIYSTSRKLSEISENVKDSVEKQVQSERMKIELVTNVSHDLKTPLTSIISYIDLLKSEELTPEAMDYVKILENKSEKLKNIVADVFSLAKATSGVDIDLEKLDAVILLNQALADAQDKIDKSERTFKTDIQPSSAMIMADGNKIYRVFQNLIDNALNYSMCGTRIFLTVTEEKGYIRIEMKNTASYEMNFSPDEITERFTRGDKSRTDGGNGLGLSIAKTFTEACGGVFRVELDGDVFKAIIVFQTVEPNDAP